MKILFAGTPTFAVPCLEALLQAGHSVVGVYTQPDRPAGRGQKITASPVKLCAISHDLLVFQPKSLREKDAQTQLADLNADLMVVVAYGLILPAAVLNAPKQGCINVHASILPRWRGAAPIQRAMLAGDTETGITIMQMDEGLDTGPMLLKSMCPILADDTAATLHDRLSQMGADALIRTLDVFPTLTATVQDNAMSTHAPKIVRDEARIDWHQAANVIERQIRAFNPWPGAYSGNNETPLKIWQAHAIVNAPTDKTKPGYIIETTPNGLDVSTGQGILRIEKLQMPGKKIQTAADLFNAKQACFEPGSSLR